MCPHASNEQPGINVVGADTAKNTRYPRPRRANKTSLDSDRGARPQEECK